MSEIEITSDKQWKMDFPKKKEKEKRMGVEVISNGQHNICSSKSIKVQHFAVFPQIWRPSELVYILNSRASIASIEVDAITLRESRRRTSGEWELNFASTEDSRSSGRRTDTWARMRTGEAIKPSLGSVHSRVNYRQTTRMLEFKLHCVQTNERAIMAEFQIHIQRATNGWTCTIISGRPSIFRHFVSIQAAKPRLVRTCDGKYQEIECPRRKTLGFVQHTLIWKTKWT